MRTKHRWIAALLGLVALAFVALACDGGQAGDESGGATPPPLGSGSGGVYLALGDSIAAGEGASDAATTSYVALVTQALRSRFGEALELRSLAVSGHTTEDLVEQQLAPAAELIRAGEVRLVTVTIGGSDLYQYSTEPACLQDPADPRCPLEDGLLGVEQRLDRVLRELREAGPETIMVVQVYPNLFSGTADLFERPAEIAFERLNGVIISVARRHDVLVADPWAAFVGRGGELTHLLDPASDSHPNDAGYRVIADAFLEVLGLSGADEGAD